MRDDRAQAGIGPGRPDENGVAAPGPHVPRGGPDPSSVPRWPRRRRLFRPTAAGSRIAVPSSAGHSGAPGTAGGAGTPPIPPAGSPTWSEAWSATRRSWWPATRRPSGPAMPSTSSSATRLSASTSGGGLCGWPTSTPGGRWEPFDELMVAAGSVPVRPNLPGADANAIRGVQTLDDGVELLRILADDQPRPGRGGGRRLHRPGDGRGDGHAGPRPRPRGGAPSPWAPSTPTWAPSSPTP